MKRHLLSFLSLLLVSSVAIAQTYMPVAVTGFNVDGIADAADASATTTQALDGSGYVLYSESYGLRYGTGAGLPGNGLIANGRHSYQLQQYKLKNILFVDAGQTDSLILTTPSSFASLSMLAMSTDGNGTNTYTVNFSDGSSVAYTNIAIHDWFNGSNAIISGLDRAQRSNGNPDYNNNDPRLYANDLALTCANRSKLVRSITVTNTGGAKTCILAVSGASLSGHTFTNINPDCPAGINGSAALSMSGGIHPYTYFWSTTPAQSAATATALPTGIYTVTVHDSMGCTIVISDTITDAIGHSTIITASADTVCLGSSLTLSTGSGASAYAWSTGASGSSISVSPVNTGMYSLTTTLVDGCKDTASIAIVANTCSGIDEQNNALMWAAYPNPNTGIFTLSLYEDIQKLESIITDMQGRVIYTYFAREIRAGETIQISLKNKAAGIYLLHVKTDQKQMIQKIMIEK